MAGFFEGDIVLPESDSRSGTNELPQKWPGGVVPYYLNSTLVGSNFVRVVRTAMRALEETTCLRFVKRTNQSDYLHLFSGQGCYSSVGRTGGNQLLSLGPGCLYVATVAHELLHAVGFHHEHTRPDRDTYITVLLPNVLEEYVNQFVKRDWSSVTVPSPFDNQSVMLYGSDAFARNKYLPTILSKTGKRLPNVYEKRGLGYWDVQRVKIYYEC